MEGSARKKWNSRRGASMVLSLLVLLVCVTAGVAALTAAGANAGRYTHMRADQQRYLAVASAVRTVREELAGQSFSASAKLTQSSSLYDPATGEMLQGTFYTMEPADQLIAPQYTGGFASWLLGDLGNCFKAGYIPEEWWEQSGQAKPAAEKSYSGLGIQTSADEPLLSQVKWELKLQEDFTLEAKFWLEEDGKQYYPMVLTMPVHQPAQEEETTEFVGASMRRVTTKKVTLTWEEADAVITQS